MKVNRPTTATKLGTRRLSL